MGKHISHALFIGECRVREDVNNIFVLLVPYGDGIMKMLHLHNLKCNQLVLYFHIVRLGCKHQVKLVLQRNMEKKIFVILTL